MSISPIQPALGAARSRAIVGAGPDLVGSPGDLGRLADAVIVSHYRSRRRVIARDAPLFGSGPLMGVHYVGVCLVVALLFTASGFLPSWLFFFYLLNLLWLRLMSTYAFAIFLLEAISSRPSA